MGVRRGVVGMENRVLPTQTPSTADAIKREDMQLDSVFNSSRKPNTAPTAYSKTSYEQVKHSSF